MASNTTLCLRKHLSQVISMSPGCSLCISGTFSHGGIHAQVSIHCGAALIHGEVEHPLFVATGMCHHPGFSNYPKLFACRTRPWVVEEQGMNILAVLQHFVCSGEVLLALTLLSYCLSCPWHNSRLEVMRPRSGISVLKTHPGHGTVTDPGRVGCPELQSEELVGFQILMVAPQGPKHWGAVVEQGLSGWACPFLTSQAHEVTQPSALGEAIWSKLVTQSARSSLPRPWGVRSHRSCYSQCCFPSAWHPQIPQPGLPGLPWQADPSPEPHTIPEPPSAMGQSSPHISKHYQWQSTAPQKSNKKAVIHSPE